MPGIRNTAYGLLKEKAKEARQIKEIFKPKFTVEEYKKYMDNFENIIRENYRDAE